MNVREDSYVAGSIADLDPEPEQTCEHKEILKPAQQSWASASVSYAS